MGVISMVSSFEIPDYCSKDMSTRDIPPLPEEEQDGGNMILQQVQVLIRHGARTPYAAHTCWRDYDIKWNNCNVSEIMEFSPSTFISDQTYWRFRLLYDAYPNELGGNCLTGQLVSEGYDQEVRNGELLKAAYIGSGHHKLFNTSVWEDLNHKTIYLRSDDEQRTLMSGQILIHSMFDLQKTEVVNWHTGDYILDTLSPNSFLCPALTSIATAAESSLEYQQTLASDRVKSLQNSLDQILGTESSGEWSWRFIQDCLMTTLCSGKETALPKEMTQELLDEIVHQVEYRYGYKSLYNDSEYSKLAMTNTAYKIRTRLEKMMRAQDSAASDALKFVLYG
jgi:2-phosphoxylose phosphatase